MSIKEPFFSVVIPNWNGQHFLKTCLDSLFLGIDQDFEVILVDNGSTDDSINFVKNNYQAVKILSLKRNHGFAKAVNEGIRSAKGEIIFLLNNDTEIDREALANLRKASKAFPDAGIFATKMLDYNNRSIVDTCGDKMTWSGRSYKYGEMAKDDGKFDDNYYIFGACAGAAAYRSDVFRKIGYFDEDFFAYLEDVDIDFRAQLAGFKCVFVPEAKVYHVGSGTAGKRSALGFRLMIKNHWHLIFKNFPTLKLITSLPKIIRSDFRFFLASIRYNLIASYLLGALQALLEFPKMIPKRIAIQKKRQVSNSYLDSIIEPDFKYKSLKEIIDGRK